MRGLSQTVRGQTCNVQRHVRSSTLIRRLPLVQYNRIRYQYEELVRSLLPIRCFTRVARPINVLAKNLKKPLKTYRLCYMFEQML